MSGYSPGHAFSPVRSGSLPPPAELILQRDFGVRAVALLGTENLRFEQPIVPGSTMIVHNKVQTARASSSRPDHGVITTEVRGVDAENEKRTFVRLIEVTLLRRLDGA